MVVFRGKTKFSKEEKEEAAEKIFLTFESWDTHRNSISQSLFAYKNFRGWT